MLIFSIMMIRYKSFGGAPSVSKYIGREISSKMPRRSLGLCPMLKIMVMWINKRKLLAINKSKLWKIINKRRSWKMINKRRL